MMQLYEIKTPDFSFKDNRGNLIQLVQEGYKQVNVLYTNKGVTRGGHYHSRCREAFFIVSGSVETTFWQAGKTDKESVIFKAGSFFEIPTCVSHSMYFSEDCVMVQLYDEPVEAKDGSKDIISED